MTTASPSRLEAIVHEARALAPDEQIPFIRNACATDDALFATAIREIREQPALWEDLESADHDAGYIDDAAVDLTGQRIGPYRVIGTLGQGGMGAVYFAERADEQFRQHVAIKLVKRGLVSRHVQNRLRIERQILATLDHPNIAKLLDGGTTPEGTPYIVMEYVDGEPIDTYCDHNQLSIEARLQLFRTICSAVHCAHQNLVVHRDLKPSNILVTHAGVPKLLDFGIAKLLDERQLMQTLAVTHADSRLMTPDHASPEQIRGDPISTASDIYVLGVLLYELLTGYKPFSLKGNRLHELERAICEQSPHPPSIAIAGMAAHSSETETIAAQRSTTSAKLRRVLRGDLDNIVLKAMRKEPERRYSSVEQFSADIERFLQGMPVVARADAWSYRTVKFVRRHVFIVGLSAALFASIVAFAVSSFVQAQRLAHERDQVAAQKQLADSQRARAERISTFLIDLFRLASPGEAGGRDAKATDILELGAARLGTELENQPELQATLLETIGRVYLNMGLPDKAEPLIQESLALRTELFGRKHETVVNSLLALSEAERDQAQWQAANAAASEALETSRALAGQDDLLIALALRNLGVLKFNEGEEAEAEALLRLSMQMYVQRVGRNDERVSYILDILSRLEKDGEAAEQLMRQALDIDRAVFPPEHPRVLQRLNNLATRLQRNGKTAEAERTYREVIPALERVNGPNHPDTPAAMMNLAVVLSDQGKNAQARQFAEAALSLERTARPTSWTVGAYLAIVASLDVGQQKLVAAEARQRETVEIFLRELPAHHQRTTQALLALGRTLLLEHKPAQAEPVFAQALSALESKEAASSIEHAFAAAALTASKVQQGKVDRAEPLLADAYVRLHEEFGANDVWTRDVRGWLEDWMRRHGRTADDAYFLTLVSTNLPKTARDE